MPGVKGRKSAYLVGHLLRILTIDLRSPAAVNVQV